MEHQDANCLYRIQNIIFGIIPDFIETALPSHHQFPDFLVPHFHREIANKIRYLARKRFRQCLDLFVDDFCRAHTKPLLMDYLNSCVTG
jgi:hypothetical protein